MGGSSCVTEEFFCVFVPRVMSVLFVKVREFMMSGTDYLSSCE